MKPIQLTREQVAGLRPAELQSYDEWCCEQGIIPADCETIPHRKLTYTEAAQVFNAFYEVERHFEEEFNTVYNRLCELRQRISEDDPLSKELRDAINEATDLHWSFGRAMGFIAYLAGSTLRSVGTKRKWRFASQGMSSHTTSQRRLATAYESAYPRTAGVARVGSLSREGG